MNIKIYEGNLLDCIKNCLKDGRFPATIEEIKEFKEKGLIDKNKWYDTSTISYKREKRTATLKELQSIKKVWKDGGQLWYVISRNLGSVANGYNNLSYVDSRLVGVAAEPQKKHKGKCCECVGDGK